MSDVALKLIQDCLINQESSLDLGNCGLKDKDMEEGSAVDKLLRQCTHLHTLILSESWYSFDKERKISQKHTKNSGDNNEFNKPPAALEKLTELRVLVCNGEYDKNLGIDSLSFISNLINLQSLHLRFNLVTHITALDRLTALKTLDLGFNQIQEITGVDKLSTLEYLNLGHNRIDEIKGLDNLSNLISLDISSNQIQEIKGLEKLSKLQSLTLTSNVIREIKGLDTLINLAYLFISSNQIQEIKGLEKLSNLIRLSLGLNQIREIKGLDTLINLNYLSLISNQISEIKGLEKLESLNTLHLRRNEITEIKNLSAAKLQYVDLSHNQIQEIKGLRTISRLQNLDLSSNQIGDLKHLVPYLKKKNALKITTRMSILGFSFFYKNEINVKNNPIVNPPIDIVKKGNEAILRYFNEKMEVLYEAKILIVGEPDAGKTSLMKKLTNPKYIIPANEDSTVGIQVIKWKCPHGKLSKPISVNIWDFGGQEVQYLTHQFFLSSDALYILLTAARRDYDNLDYWFNIISLLGKNENNQNSELIVVANEIKMQEGQINKSFDAKKYQELYPDLLFTFQAVNLATAFDKDGRFATLQHLIKEKLNQLKILGKELPAKWGIARKALFDLKVNYVSIQDYLAVCKNVDINEKLALDLSEYQHKIGEIVHFQTEGYVILNPKWALDGVYSVLKRKEIENSDGHFTQKQIYAIWDEAGYSYPEKNLLLSLMVKDNFEVTYKIQGKKDEYIAPQLLAVTQPDYQWNKKGALHFRYLYPFMPKGIITRLIVRLHEAIRYVNGKGLVWRTGVFFEKNGCIAKVEETKIPATGQQVIAIEISGNTTNRKLLLYDVCNTIEGIHKNSFSNIFFERQIPCNCEHCINLEQPGFFNYSELINYYNEGIEKIRCKVKVKNEIKVSSLLEDIFDVDFTKIGYIHTDLQKEKIDEILATDPFGFGKNEKKKVFISYSHDDIGSRKKMQQYLVNIEREGLIEIWQDGLIKAGEDWDKNIKIIMQNADICILLISQELISSSYAHEVEFKTIMERHKNDKCRIIPILIKDCDWKNWHVYPPDIAEALGKKKTDYQISNFQFLPLDKNKRVKAINKWARPEEAWLQVADAIRDFCRN